jgi:hypothetical protein
MLNILPKLALVAINTYFKVLANVTRPLYAFDEDIQILFHQHNVSGFLGDIDCALD